jgi:ribosomal protein L37AE/L43A
MSQKVFNAFADSANLLCVKCGSDVDIKRWTLGYHVCLECGEAEARSYKHTIVPMPKSNYIVVTDLELLKGLNSSHKSK